MAVLVGGVAFAADDDGFKPMFNGKDFTGWDVLKCEAEITKDGELLIKDGNGLVQTKEQYANFVIAFEWKALKADKWDSGVYFRYTSVPKNRPWPGRWQANLRKGMEGNVGGIKGAASTGLCKDGEWNQFVLTVDGTGCSLEINGKPAWKGSDGLTVPKGFISIQAEVPQGGQFLFRNVKIKTLP